MPKFSFLSCPSPFKAIWHYSDLYSTLVGSFALFLVNYGIFFIGVCMDHAQIFIFVLSLSFFGRQILQRLLIDSGWCFSFILSKLQYFFIVSARVMPRFSFLSCPCPFLVARSYNDF